MLCLPYTDAYFSMDANKKPAGAWRHIFFNGFQQKKLFMFYTFRITLLVLTLSSIKISLYKI